MGEPVYTFQDNRTIRAGALQNVLVHTGKCPCRMSDKKKRTPEKVGRSEPNKQAGPKKNIPAVGPAHSTCEAG